MKRGILILVFLIIFSGYTSAQSFSDLCVESVVTDINPSSVEIDEEFTVGISIENCGQLIPDEVTFEITQVSEDVIIKEPLVINIGQLNYANSKRFITYHMRTTSDATPGNYVIKTKLTASRDKASVIENGTISITVTSDEAELALASVKTNPVFPIQDQETTITLRLENSGRGDANSVKVDLLGLDDFTGSKKSFLGELSAQDDGILTFSLIPNKAGDYEYEMVVTYRDDFGEHQYKEKLQIVVQKPQNNLGIAFVVLVILSLIVFLGLRKIRSRRRQYQMVEKLQRRGR